MKALGIVEARSTPSALLEQGEEVAIIRRGKAMARLVPVGAASRDWLADTIARLRHFGAGAGSAICRAGH